MKRNRIFSLFLAFVLVLSSCAAPPQPSFSLESIPEYSGEPYVVLEENQPAFSAEELVAESFETYSPHDALGRCGTAYACVGLDIMPTEERGSIGQVKPTGWHLAKYDCVDGKYLYNRCHLIGYQLTGENANEENLITGTRYLNVDGMLPFENQIAEYVEQTGNHVLYRVTPIFEGIELVARGVQMEAKSIEDDGAGVCFNVYAYNVQPGVEIEYATGESWLAGESGASQSSVPTVSQTQEETMDYVLNTSSEKFHLPDCSGVSKMSQDNKQLYNGTRQSLIDMGYQPCGQCKP